MENLVIGGAFILGAVLLKLIASGIEALINRNKPDEVETENEYHEIMNTPSKATTLTPLVDEALDLYDIQNIRVPLDIIEDISYLEFKNVDEVVRTIEAHRINWKYENQKKLIRGQQKWTRY